MDLGFNYINKFWLWGRFLGFVFSSIFHDICFLHSSLNRFLHGCLSWSRKQELKKLAATVLLYSLFGKGGLSEQCNDDHALDWYSKLFLSCVKNKTRILKFQILLTCHDDMVAIMMTIKILMHVKIQESSWNSKSVGKILDPISFQLNNITVCLSFPTD